MIKIDDQCYIEIFESKGKIFIRVANSLIGHIATHMTFPGNISPEEAIKEFKNQTKQV